YVIVAFTDITAATFVAGTEELQQGSVEFNAGGAVAAGGTLYLILAILMGFIQRFAPKVPLWVVTLRFRAPALRVCWFRAATLAHDGARPSRVGNLDPGVLLHRIGDAGVGAPPAARISRRLRVVFGADRGRDRRAVRALHRAAARVQGLQRGRHDGCDVPVPV